jgi:hypothetical protein
VQAELLALGELAQGCNVIDDAVWEVGRRADKQDGVAVNEARDAANIYLIRGGRAVYVVNLDLEVLASLAESRVCGRRQDPIQPLEYHAYHATCTFMVLTSRAP